MHHNFLSISINTELTFLWEVVFKRFGKIYTGFISLPIFQKESRNILKNSFKTSALGEIKMNRFGKNGNWGYLSRNNFLLVHPFIKHHFQNQNENNIWFVISLSFPLLFVQIFAIPFYLCKKKNDIKNFNALSWIPYSSKKWNRGKEILAVSFYGNIKQCFLLLWQPSL